MTGWLLLIALAVAPDAQADFTTANERALQNDLRSAITLYESLLDRGVKNPDVLFNLGNAYAKNEQFVQAIIAYERALKLSPGDPDIQANLDAVRLRLDPNSSNGSIGAPDAPLNAADALAPWASAVPSGLAALVLLVGNALFWAGWWLGDRRTAALVVGGILMAVGGLSVLAHAIVSTDRVAIVTRPTSLREGPRPQFRTTGTAAPGTRVRILDDNDTWREVQKDDGTTGWLGAKNLEVL